MSLISDLSDLFSIKRRESCNANSSVKASADGQRNRSRRRSLSTRYQALFSNINQDRRGVNDANFGSKQTRREVASAILPSGEYTTVGDTVHPVTTVEPQEPDKPADNPDAPEGPRLRRRPKTPVKRVGELEGYSENTMRDCSTALAEEYQAVLEPMPPTTAHSATSRRSLRKIGRQHDLRRTSIDSDDTPASPNLSEVDTVVGSNRSPRQSMRRAHNSFSSSGSSWSSTSNSSYYSVASEKESNFPEKKDFIPTSPRKVPDSTTSNIEMKICLDLLKQDLSSAVSPEDLSDSTFGLQLWLMIESYESMKRRLHHASRTMPEGKETSEFTFQVLDHWLEALYSVYNSMVPEGRPSAKQGEAAAKSGGAFYEKIFSMKDGQMTSTVKSVGHGTEIGGGIILCS